MFRGKNSRKSGQTRQQPNNNLVIERQTIRHFLHRRHQVILRNLLLYLLLSFAYIFISDYFLFFSRTGLSTYEISLAKGWLFVFGSTLFFYLMLRQRSRAYERAIQTLDRQEEQVQAQAHIDPLTHLPNRHYLEEVFRRQLLISDPDRHHLGLIYLDLDDFRLANEIGGYSAGNTVLCHVAETLQSLLRPGDLAVRLSADEFAVLLEPVTYPSELLEFTDQLRSRVQAAWQLKKKPFYLTISAGGAIFPQHGHQLELLLQHAEQAMLQSKTIGKNSTCLYYPGIYDLSSQASENIADLRQAIREECFCLHYQPQFRLADGRLRGLEALLRQIGREDRILIYPQAFIPLAESTGLIHPLTAVVSRLAGSQVDHWHKQSCLPPQLAINISSQQLQQENIKEQMLPLQKKLQSLGSGLELEITESVLMDNPVKAIDIINDLRRSEIRFALDDFGAGYSSLTWLRQLPVDLVKIDRQFIQSMLENPQDAQVVRLIIELAHNMGFEVLAEGIETREQLSWLQAAGCEYGQGYLLGRPVDPAGLEKLLTAGWIDLASL